jgi:hypothetical protein
MPRITADRAGLSSRQAASAAAVRAMLKISGVGQTRYTGATVARNSASVKSQGGHGRGGAAQDRVAEEERGAQGQRVGQQEAARAEELHERRGGDGIGERLGKVDPRVVRAHAPDPGEAARPVPTQAAAGPLQEDALRARGDLAPDAEDVPGLVAQVAVLGQAPGHGVVRGSVPPELRQLDPPDEGDEQGRDHAQRDAGGAIRQIQPASR